MPRERRSVGHERGSTEFDRVANFSDAVYAIAMTLLVLEIGVPSLAVDPDSPRVMLDALNDKIPEIVSFAVSFLVIGPAFSWCPFPLRSGAGADWLRGCRSESSCSPSRSRS